jgi:hypothetical protein
VSVAFDPIAVGDEIAAYELEAAKAKGSLLECSKKSGALLLDVQQNHPEHLEVICTRVGISRSRRYELLAIAGGRRTEEENRQISKARQDRKREKDKAAKALPAPKLEESVTTDVTDSQTSVDEPETTTDDDPEVSAERRKAEYSAMENAAEAQSDSVEAECAPVEASGPQLASVEAFSQPKVKATLSERALV